MSKNNDIEYSVKHGDTYTSNINTELLFESKEDFMKKVTNKQKQHFCF